MQHAPDKGTGKAYAFTEGCTPLGRKDWGVWDAGAWQTQPLTATAVTTRPEATRLCDRLFHRTCKLLRNCASWEGVIAPPPLLRIAFSSLVDPLLLPHIHTQSATALAVQKARLVVDCLPEGWFKFGMPGAATNLVACVQRLRVGAGVGDTASIMHMYRKLNLPM
jgi:hypothetical protein